MRKESKKPYNTKSKTTLVFLNCEGFSNHIIKLWAKHPNLIRQKAKQPLSMHIQRIEDKQSKSAMLN